MKLTVRIGVEYATGIIGAQHFKLRHATCGRLQACQFSDVLDIMAIYGLWVSSQFLLKYGVLNTSKVINKAGGLVYQRNFGGQTRNQQPTIT